MTPAVSPPVVTDRPRPRMVVVGPLPPPLGGVQLMNRMLIGSSLGRDFEIHTVDTSKKVMRWAVERQSWKSPFVFLRHAWMLLVALAGVRPAIVYVHAASGFSFARDWAFLLIGRLSGARVVCHYHGTLHTRFPSTQTPTGRFAGRWMMAAAHRVLVLSPGYREAFAKAWHRDDLEWTPNLTDVAQFQAVAAVSPVAPWLKAGERGVLYLGRLSAPKGFGDLLDAMPAVLRQHPETRFVLAGVAETEALEPELRAEVARRGLAERVTFLGSLEGPEKIRAYLGSSVFVAPSWTEAFPLVIPEAMAAGLPMVVTAVGAVPDFVRDGEDGFLIPPRDPAALADRVHRLLADEPLRARIAARLRERAMREFDIEVGAVRVRSVLEGLARG